MTKAIYFDMDGTIADLYGVDGWLDSLIAEQTKPYREAKPLVDMRKLGKLLNELQAQGWSIGVISWLSRSGSLSYSAVVTAAKYKWLADHLPSVNFDEIHVVPYGTPKAIFSSGSDVLFDDEEKNRTDWAGVAYDVQNILEILKNF